MSDVSAHGAPDGGATRTAVGDTQSLEAAVVRATQHGLPLEPRPYHAAAARAGLDPDAMMSVLADLLARGAVRRIAAVPNHYALGWRANGMSVWDVDDARLADCGRAVSALPFVSHCYHRPRRPPAWRYNLFAMVHGRDRDEVEDKVARIAKVIGPASRDHDVLYSKRILKKTGLRLT